MSAGCVRRVSFFAPFCGETTSELVVADRGSPAADGQSRVVWRQLESSTRLNLLGETLADGEAFPEFGVALEGGPGGTLVTMTYNFARVDLRGPLFFLASCMPALLRWHLVRRRHRTGATERASERAARVSALASAGHRRSDAVVRVVRSAAALVDFFRVAHGAGASRPRPPQTAGVCLQGGRPHRGGADQTAREAAATAAELARVLPIGGTAAGRRRSEGSTA